LNQINNGTMPDYVISDTLSPTYSVNSPSMYDFTHLFYGSGEYGILAESSGFVLLGRNYTGPILYYTPIDVYYYSSEASNNFGSLHIQKANLINGYITASNITNYTYLWSGPGIYLPPGNYNITYQLESTSTDINNKLLLGLVEKGLYWLNQTIINGSKFSIPNKLTNITLTLNLTNFGGVFDFIGSAIQWNGTIKLKGILINQISPPSRSLTFKEIYNIMKLIPKNSTVFSQSALPDPVSEILTEDTVLNLNQINNGTMPDYVISDTLSPAYSVNSPSMYDFTHLFYGSGEYEVLVDATNNLQIILKISNT
ncbi:MAG: hypothetical protein QXH07_06630, partial [Thermoplasmata archaeon]